MSLILEALRRSEAERQRAQAPGLFVEQRALRRRRATPPVWVWALPGACALLIGLVWWQWPAAEGGEPAAVTAAPAVTAPPTPTTTADIAVAPAEVAAPPPAPGPVDAPLPARAPAPAEPVATVDAWREPASAPPAPAPAVVDAEPPPAAEPIAAAPAAAPEPPLPRLADLPADERAALPPLRLSMHVFSDDPARRFVIVDERRLGEGGSPAPGLVVEEIRRDGAVLSVNGRRVLLPRP